MSFEKRRSAPVLRRPALAGSIAVVAILAAGCIDSSEKPIPGGYYTYVSEGEGMLNTCYSLKPGRRGVETNTIGITTTRKGSVITREAHFKSIPISVPSNDPSLKQNQDRLDCREVVRGETLPSRNGWVYISDGKSGNRTIIGPIDTDTTNVASACEAVEVPERGSQQIGSPNLGCVAVYSVTIVGQ